jgi:hypothetical protein
VERRSGFDRREHSPAWSVSLESYFDRTIADVERRVVVLERHDEILRDRQGEYLTRERYEERHQDLAGSVEQLRRAGSDSQFLTRERYDERHAQLEHRLDIVDRSKPDADAVQALAKRVDELEKTAGQELAIRTRRDMTRQRLILTVGAVGAFTSAGMTLMLHAVGVV